MSHGAAAASSRPPAIIGRIANTSTLDASSPIDAVIIRAPALFEGNPHRSLALVITGGLGIGTTHWYRHRHARAGCDRNPCEPLYAAE